MLLRLPMCICATIAAFPAGLAGQEPYHDPGKVVGRILDAEPIPQILLSPDRTRILLLQPASLPSISEVAGPELRLAGIRLDPRTSARAGARTFTSLVIQPLQGDVRRIVLPWLSRVADPMWSPDGRIVAFTLIEGTGVSLWTAEASSGDIRLVLGPVLNAAFGNPCRWLPAGGGFVCARIPADRSGLPDRADAPAGPIVREGAAAGLVGEGGSTLLQNPRDEALFEHFATSQLITVSLTGQVRPLGPAGIHPGFSVSPDGRFLLVETLHAPWSHVVPWQRFGTRTEVWDLTGQSVHLVSDRQVEEGPVQGKEPGIGGPRAIGWRADAQATLAWLEASTSGAAGSGGGGGDRLVTHEAPFSAAPVTLAEFASRADRVTWARSDLAIVSEQAERAGRERAWAIDPSRPGAPPRLLFERPLGDPATDRGQFITVPAAGGDSVLLTSRDGRFAFLTGDGPSAEGDRPFLDRMEIASGKTLRLFRSDPPVREEAAAILDAEAGHVLTRRESATEPPNYFVRDLRKNPASQLSQITRFQDPAPEFAGVTRRAVTFAGADGAALNATMYLPPGYDASKGRLPFLVWIGSDERGAANGSLRFVRPEGASPLYLLLGGFGVLELPAAPELAERDEASEERSLAQLVAGTGAVAAKLVAMGVADEKRMVVGGHGAGATAAAHLLARSDLFRAGIAMSGGHERMLAILGRERDARSGGSGPAAPGSPVREPLLLIHGLSDESRDARPVQSERLFEALTQAGDSARLVLLPGESHSYRARESVGQVLYEMARWMERWVGGGQAGRQ